MAKIDKKIISKNIHYIIYNKCTFTKIRKLTILKIVQMEISEFMNKLGIMDLSSFIKVLEAYQEAFKEGFSQVENLGFNEDLGFVYCCLNGNITIFSRFGQNVFYSPSDDENKEFSTLDELVEYLKK
jgi:hypothetical protein